MTLPPPSGFLVALLLACNLHAGVESRFISVGELRLHYVDWGGDGGPLIFVPGGCDTAFVFDDVARRLASFRVVGLTARGCGASDRPASGYDMGHQIADILGFMNALGIQQATLIGHSSGGGKITQFAKSHPDRVSRLIYLDTVFRYVAPGLEDKLDREIAVVVGGRPTDSAENWKRSARMWEPGARSAAMDRNFEELFNVEPGGRLKPRRAIVPEWTKEVNADMQAGLYFETRIAQPALMIFAMDTDGDRARQFDRQVRRELKPLVRLTEKHRRDEIQSFRENGNHVRVVELRHTAHYCFVQRPDTVTRLITSFLTARTAHR